MAWLGSLMVVAALGFGCGGVAPSSAVPAPAVPAVPAVPRFSRVVDESVPRTTLRYPVFAGPAETAGPINESIRDVLLEQRRAFHDAHGSDPDVGEDGEPRPVWTLLAECETGIVDARLVSVLCILTQTRGADSIAMVVARSFALERGRARRLELADLFVDLAVARTPMTRWCSSEGSSDPPKESWTVAIGDDVLLRPHDFMFVSTGGSALQSSRSCTIAYAKVRAWLRAGGVLDGRE